MRGGSKWAEKERSVPRQSGPAYPEQQSVARRRAQTATPWLSVGSSPGTCQTFCCEMRCARSAVSQRPRMHRRRSPLGACWICSVPVDREGVNVLCAVCPDVERGFILAHPEWKRDRAHQLEHARLRPHGHTRGNKGVEELWVRGRRRRVATASRMGGGGDSIDHKIGVKSTMHRPLPGTGESHPLQSGAVMDGILPFLGSLLRPLPGTESPWSCRDGTRWCANRPPA